MSENGGKKQRKREKWGENEMGKNGAQISKKLRENQENVGKNRVK